MRSELSKLNNMATLSLQFDIPENNTIDIGYIKAQMTAFFNKIVVIPSVTKLENSASIKHSLSDAELEAELSDFAPITDADFPDISKKQFMAYCRTKSGKGNKSVERWL